MSGAPAPSPQPAWLAAERPPAPPQRRLSGVRPTPFGLLLVVGVVAVLVTSRSAVDPQIVAAVAIVLIGMAVIGTVLPLLAVRRIELEAWSPRDATVGEVVPVRVGVRRCRDGCQVRLRDPDSEWHDATDGDSGDINHVADRRGSFDGIRVEARVTTPLGIVAAHRVAHLILPAAVDVAPAPLTVPWSPELAPLEGASATHSTPILSGEVVRSVRPYTSGDPAHLVHWPSTARTGALVVREMEPPARVRLAIVLDLRELGADTERAASFAHGLARAVLDAEGEVLLATYDGRAEASVTAPVRSRLDLGRRLARAALGPPGEVPEGWPVTDVREWWWRNYAWHARPDLWEPVKGWYQGHHAADAAVQADAAHGREAG